MKRYKHFDNADVILLLLQNGICLKLAHAVVFEDGSTAILDHDIDITRCNGLTASF